MGWLLITGTRTRPRSSGLSILYVTLPRSHCVTAPPPRCGCGVVSVAVAWSCARGVVSVPMAWCGVVSVSVAWPRARGVISVSVA